MQFSQDETAQILMYLGYDVNNHYKFKIRDEHTASASINPKDGKIKDFGSGWYGSIIDFMVTYHNLSQKEAFARAGDIANKPHSFKLSTSSTHHKPSDKEQQSNFITQEYIDKFQNERKEYFTRFWELLSETLPTASKEAKQNIAKRYEIGYSKKADRLIMPIRNENGECMTFWKYNKNPTPFMGSDGNMITLPKVMFSKNKERCPFNLQDLKSFAKNQKDNDTIFIVEGEKDCLNALANGFNAITLGSASTRLSDKYIPLFKGINVTIAYDNDEAGRSCAKALKETLKDICKNVEIIDWKKIAKNVGIKEELKTGFDFTDFLVAGAKLQEKNNEISK
ncbi:hypothetical protein AWR31_08070 [Campylobacter fetus subsp. venerealis]|nr:hypothetical protein AWR31_08070 [Campylobacter fetus subsp. venerealis]